MQKLRIVHGRSVRDVAGMFGCSPSHVSRVERGGTKPSRALVLFYESEFDAEGLLLSLFEVAEHAAEDKRRRAGGRRVRQRRAAPGDASELVAETVPNGSLMTPGEYFVKRWTIRNVGSVEWRGRRLERQGPVTGPGLITSPRYAEVEDTSPGQVVNVELVLKAPTYDSTSIAYFKMIDADGLLCFPDDYALGLDVVVRVAGQLPTQPLGPR